MTTVIMNVMLQIVHLFNKIIMECGKNSDVFWTYDIGMMLYCENHNVNMYKICRDNNSGQRHVRLIWYDLVQGFGLSLLPFVRGTPLQSHIGKKWKHLLLHIHNVFLFLFCAKPGQHSENNSEGVTHMSQIKLECSQNIKRIGFCQDH